jgi:hypothetical protein
MFGNETVVMRNLIQVSETMYLYIIRVDEMRLLNTQKYY